MKRHMCLPSQVASISTTSTLQQSPTMPHATVTPLPTKVLPLPRYSDGSKGRRRDFQCRAPAAVFSFLRVSGGGFSSFTSFTIRATSTNQLSTSKMTVASTMPVNSTDHPAPPPPHTHTYTHTHTHTHTRTHKRPNTQPCAKPNSLNRGPTLQKTPGKSPASPLMAAKPLRSKSRNLARAGKGCKPCAQQAEQHRCHLREASAYHSFLRLLSRVWLLLRLLCSCVVEGGSVIV